MIEQGIPSNRQRPPDGSFSTAQFAAREKMSRSGAMGRLRDMAEAGVVECVGKYFIPGASSPSMFFWRVKGRAQ